MNQPAREDSPHWEAACGVRPSAAFNLGRRGAPNAPSHPFLTVCFPLVLPVCTCFPFPPSPSQDLTFFPLGSQCVLTEAFVTRHLLSGTGHSLPLSFSLFHTPSISDLSLCFAVLYLLFARLLAGSLPPDSPPSLSHALPSLSIFASVWISSLSRAICFLWQLFELSLQACCAARV